MFSPKKSEIRISNPSKKIQSKKLSGVHSNFTYLCVHCAFGSSESVQWLLRIVQCKTNPSETNACILKTQLLLIKTHKNDDDYDDDNSIKSAAWLSEKQTATSHMHTRMQTPKASLICFGWVSDAVFCSFTSMHRIVCVDVCCCCRHHCHWHYGMCTVSFELYSAMPCNLCFK